MLGLLVWIIPGYIWGIILFIGVLLAIAVGITNFIYEVFDE